MKVIVVLVFFAAALAWSQSDAFDHSDNQHPAAYREVDTSLSFLSIDDYYQLIKKGQRLFLLSQNDCLVLNLQSYRVHLGFCYEENSLPKSEDNLAFAPQREIEEFDFSNSIELTGDTLINLKGYECLSFKPVIPTQPLSGSCAQPDVYWGLLLNGNYFDLAQGVNSNANLVVGVPILDFTWIKFSPGLMIDSRSGYSRLICTMLLVNYFFIDINDELGVLHASGQFGFLNQLENNNIEVWPDAPFVSYMAGLKLPYEYWGQGAVRLAAQMDSLNHFKAQKINVSWQHNFSQWSVALAGIYGGLNQKMDYGLSIYNQVGTAKLSYRYVRGSSQWFAVAGWDSKFLCYANLFLDQARQWHAPTERSHNFSKFGAGFYVRLPDLWTERVNFINRFWLGLEAGIDRDSYLFKINLATNFGLIF